MTADSFDYRMVKCSRCGSTTALEMGTCRVCGAELKGSNTIGIVLFGVVGAVMIVVILSALMYLTRETEIGAFLALGIAGLSFAVSIVGYVWLVVAAFQVSGAWGAACMFVPLAQLAFLYRHTDRALVPFILNVFSLVLLLIASLALP